MNKEEIKPLSYFLKQYADYGEETATAMWEQQTKKIPALTSSRSSLKRIKKEKVIKEETPKPLSLSERHLR